MSLSVQRDCVCGGRGVYARSLYLPLTFAVSLKLIQKIKSIFKQKISEEKSYAGTVSSAETGLSLLLTGQGPSLALSVPILNSRV